MATRWAQIVDGAVTWIGTPEQKAQYDQPASFDTDGTPSKETIGQALGLVLVEITDNAIASGFTYDGKGFAPPVTAAPAPEPVATAAPATQTISVTPDQWKTLAAAAQIIAGLKPS